MNEATIALVGALAALAVVTVPALANLRRRTAAVTAVGEPATTEALRTAVVARPGRTSDPGTEIRTHAMRSLTT